MVERIAFFTEIGVSLDVGVQALADLANVSKDLSVKPGASIFESGEANEHLFLIVDGEVEATRKDPDVRRRIEARYDVCWFPAQSKKGYSGVATLARKGLAGTTHTRGLGV